MTATVTTQAIQAPLPPVRDRPEVAVNSHTEWDPLDEIIVGRLAGGVFPTWQDSMAATMPESSWSIFKERGGTPFPEWHLAAAEKELAGFVAALEGEGVRVLRPDETDHAAPISTKDWNTRGGLYAGMPRDHLMILGDTIVEAPMSWRCRYYEGDAYRDLIKSYFRDGARWLQAPRPQLTDQLFSAEFVLERDDGYAITEFEPVFDTADFMRFGRDIVVQRSHVTNGFGIDWLRRCFQDEFRVHEVEVNDAHAMHIDATLMPLGPRTLLVNPERFVPCDLFRGWTVLEAPKSTLPDDWPMYFCSSWVNMNILSVDPETVIVEQDEEPLIDLLAASGFRVIPVPFRHVYSLGGSFHCVTVDVRRRSRNVRYLATDSA